MMSVNQGSFRTHAQALSHLRERRESGDPYAIGALSASAEEAEPILSQFAHNMLAFDDEIAEEIDREELERIRTQKRKRDELPPTKRLAEFCADKSCDAAEIRDCVSDGADIAASRALFIAAGMDRPAIIGLLFSLGGDVNRHDKFGDAPLHLAAKRCHCSSVKALLECRATPSLPNKAGDTPIQVAAARKLANRNMMAKLGGMPAWQAKEVGAREEREWAEMRGLLGEPGTLLSKLLEGPEKAKPAVAKCPCCEKMTSDWPKDAAHCGVCEEDFGCNTCWVDHGNFCEGCPAFMCHGCQKGWNHMYGPTGDIGISCSECKPFSHQD